MANKPRKDQVSPMNPDYSPNDSQSVLLHLLYAPIETLGPGRRVGIWFQGCSIHCEGCIAPENQSFDPAFATDVSDAIERIVQYYKGIHDISGVTISGGEPFDQPEALLAIVSAMNDFGIRDILVYSGYLREEISPEHSDILGLVAALVDGPFRLGETTSAGWKGSNNQRFHLLREEFEPRYRSWCGIPSGKLQIVHSSDEAFLIGIPRQQDVPLIKARLAELNK